jgi:photosystem II stability/assembly factor-like uncharacterized protein
VFRVFRCAVTGVAVTLLGVVQTLGFAAASAQINFMQLVTPEFGWVEGRGKVMRTTDGGTSWTEITPPTASGESFGRVYFLDPQHGWTIAETEKEDGSGNRVFRTLATSDGGATWKSYPMPLPANCWECAQGALAGLTFVDPQHGWTFLDVGGMFHGGVLLGTSDGGRTWTRLSNQWFGYLKFLDSSRGWSVSSEMTGAGLDLYATRDGGRTLQKRTFEPPSGIGKESDAKFSAPVFSNATTGKLPVSFVRRDETVHHYRSVVAVYATDNGGDHWRLDRVFATSDGWVPPPVIVQGQVVWTYGTDNGHLVVVHDGMATAPSQDTHGLAVPDSVQFADAQHGWILLLNGGCRGFKCDCYEESTLVRTTDGGATLTVVDPGLGPPENVAPCSGGRPQRKEVR